MADVAGLYDEWADDYDAQYADWSGTVRAHGALFASALASAGVEPPATVLDATCGIGTQAIGLALEGYSVTGTDLSAGEVARAGHEADRFGVAATFEVANLLTDVAVRYRDGFDAVMSANSLTHFGDAALLAAAYGALAAAARPGGVVVTTNRDYDVVSTAGSSCTPPAVSTVDGTRRVSFQLWDGDGQSYSMESVVMSRPEGGEWSLRSHSTVLRAWKRAELQAAADAAGLTNHVWIETDWQPLLISRLPES